MEALHCSALLELPNKELEDCFWTDGTTLRTYTNWDLYISINVIVSNLIVAKSLWPALANRAALHSTWHMHANILGNFITSALMIFLIKRHHAFYICNRRRLVVWNRLLRLVYMLLAVSRSSSELQAVVAKAINVKQEDTTGVPLLRAAVLNLTRPTFVAPLITMAHASWVFETKHWLPLQVVTVLMAIFGSQRHQHCRLTADASSALLLQPVCRGMTDLQHYIASSIFGHAVMDLSLMSSLAACTTMTSAARVLVWYSQLLYALMMPLAGFCTLEWRLKAKWVEHKLGKQLVYGPWGWPRSNTGLQDFAAWLQSFVTWVLYSAGIVAIIWSFSLWVVPHLPLMECETCVDKGTCRQVAPCEGFLCDSPGHWTAVVMYLQMLFTYFGHLAVTRAM